MNISKLTSLLFLAACFQMPIKGMHAELSQMRDLLTKKPFTSRKVTDFLSHVSSLPLTMKSKMQLLRFYQQLHFNMYDSALHILCGVPESEIHWYIQIILNQFSRLSFDDKSSDLIMHVVKKFPKYVPYFVDSAFNDNDQEAKMRKLLSIMDSYEFFNSEMKSAIKERLTRENILQRVYDENSFMLHIKTQEYSSACSYQAQLYQHNKKIGYSTFRTFFRNEKKAANIGFLHIYKSDDQKKGNGSRLLSFVLEKLKELDCEYVTLRASPFDVHISKSVPEKLPRLLVFYNRHGFQAFGDGKDMVCYLAQQTNGIAKL